MKIKFLASAMAFAAMVGVGHAQTVIEITGATAFRSAAVNSINTAFQVAGNNTFATGFANTDVAGNATSLTSGSMQIWRGTFPGIAGITIIRTSWNGSVEGIRAVTRPGVDVVTGDQNNPLYLRESILGANGTSTGVRFHADPNGPGAAANALNYELAQSDMTFSDVAQSATPVSGLAVSGGPVGVVVFTMVASRTWADDNLSVNNISAQQFRTMARRGSVALSFFTGAPADTALVYLTGRNDGSGTRTSYLSETGVGASTPINQYVGYDRSQATLPSIFLVPENGGFNHLNQPQPAYRSTVWGNNQNGNGGHVSSGDVRSDLAKATTNTVVYGFVDADEDGTISASERETLATAAKLYLISWITYSDAFTARNGANPANPQTARILGYNGVRLDQLGGATPSNNLSNVNAAADLAKIVNGTYTAWNFQQLLYVASRTGAAAVFTDLKSRLNNASVIGTAGVPLGLMNVNRTVDGGVILPGAPN